ncbi:MAG: hypothetical protein QM740_02000 [Acidovorax sp.]
MTAVHAQQHSVRISSEVEQVENPMLAPVSPGSATVLRLVPSYTYETQSDRSQSRFSASAILEKSSNTVLLASRTYPSLGYTWGYSWPTSSLELRANLTESATRNTELRDLGLVTVDTVERQFLTGAAWNKDLTERTRFTLDAQNRRVTYDSPLRQNFIEQQVTSRLRWEATERTSYYFEPGYGRLLPSGVGEDSLMSRWLVGVQSALGPDWALVASAGQARIHGSQRDSDLIGGLRLVYSGNRLTSEAEWAKSVQAVGGIIQTIDSMSGYTKTESLRFRAGYRLTEGATLSASVMRSRSSGFIGAVGTVFNLTFEQELAANWSLVLAVDDRRTKSDQGSSGRGWAARAALVYLFPGQ